MKHLEKICIVCPVGCRLSAEIDAEGKAVVSGNNCPRGKVYLESEISDPRRVVTFAVTANGGDAPCLPIKTDGALPVKLIPGLLAELRRADITHPVTRGDVLIANIAGSGISAVFTRGSDE